MTVSPVASFAQPILRALALAAALAGSACSVEPSDPGNFYEIDEKALSVAPGDILRAEPLPGAPQGARGWRVLYRSTGLSGEPIAVSGVVVAPAAEASKPRPVVAWAHGTTGVANRCAPSLRSDFYAHVPGLKRFLERGYVVAATDYAGLGAGGTHPYLAGISEGRAVLDSVRAATRLEGTGASNDFAVWGHSQGGHAALFAGQLAASYAPELKLAGVAAAAPATDLTILLRDDLQTKAGKILTAFALWSWHRVYEAPLSQLLDDSTGAAVDRIAEDCLEGPIQGLVLAHQEKTVDQEFLKRDLTETPPWKDLLVQNSPDAKKTDGPLFIAQGAADQVVHPAVTRTYIEAACRNGTPVRIDWRQGLGHLKILDQSAGAAAEWIGARFAGTPPADDCGNLAALTDNPG